MTIRTRGRGGRLATVLTVPALLFALVGCGSSGAADGSSSEPSASRDAWTLSFNQCLRENGVDVEDQTSGSGPRNMNAPNAPADVIEKCTAKLGPMPAMSKDEQSKQNKDMEKMLLKIADCYRENGVSVPDPVPGQALSVPSNTPADVISQCGGGTAPGGLVPQ